jgi:hypothetical protein
VDARDQVVEVSFVRGYGFTSGCISRLTGFWTHVDVIFPDGMLWGARSDRIRPKGSLDRIPAGVQARPGDYEPWEHRTIYGIRCTSLQQQSYYAFFKSQEGHPYDWRAIVNNFGFGYNWRTPDHWFCSDIGTAAGESADMWGIPDGEGERKLFVDPWGTSPGMLAMLISGLPDTFIVSAY